MTLSPPTGAFEPEQLEQIAKAFNGIWAAVVANLPTRDTLKDDELKILISKKLFALAKCVCNGELLGQLIWQTAPLNAMINEKADDIVLAVISGEIVITKPGTEFLLAYRKADDRLQLSLARRSLPKQTTSPDVAEFRVRAWAAAKDKARALGWIV